MYNMRNVINTTVSYIVKLLRVYILRVLIKREIFFLMSLMFYLYEMIDIH